MKSTTDRILDNVNQPVVDSLVEMVKRNEINEAIDLLLELEGHWVTAGMAREFIDDINTEINKRRI